jgi:hypothetical protein
MLVSFTAVSCLFYHSVRRLVGLVGFWMLYMLHLALLVLFYRTYTTRR